MRNLGEGGALGDNEEDGNEPSVLSWMQTDQLVAGAHGKMGWPQSKWGVNGEMAVGWLLRSLTTPPKETGWCPGRHSPVVRVSA